MSLILVRFSLCMLVAFAALSTESTAFAACTSPAADAGATDYISAEYKFCDGTNWVSMTVLNTGTLCSQAGAVDRFGADLRFCNGTNWISMIDGTNLTACATAGARNYSVANAQFEYCDGSFWHAMRAPAVADACSGKTIGQAAAGTTALCLGTFDNGKYMIMPSGCANSISNPTCTGGIDTVQKEWDVTYSNYDFPGLTNFPVSTPATNERGHYSAPVVYPTSGMNASQYCENMTYGGFTDWYLPSKSELAFVYCKATPVTAHNVAYPNEDPNCTSNGGKQSLLTGFESNYWSSSEAWANESHIQNFTNGVQTTSGKANPSNIRCVRRYSGTDAAKVYSMPESITGMDVTTGSTVGSCVNVKFYNVGDVATTALTISLSSANFETTGCTDACTGVSLPARVGVCSVGVRPKSSTNGAIGGGITASASGTSRQVSLRGTASGQAANPCSGTPALGTACTGGSIFAGSFDGATYMTTPGGCADEKSPSCSGSDTLTKTWRGSTGVSADQSRITDVALASSVSSSSERGQVLWPVMYYDSNISSNSASHYCADLSYGGYSDWYLPSKSELAYLYCHSNTGTHNTSNPQENPNCTSYGGKTAELLNFAVGDYWSTTEVNSTDSWAESFSTGAQAASPKSASAYVRCVRRVSNSAQLVAAETSYTFPAPAAGAVVTACKILTFVNVGDIATSSISSSTTGGSVLTGNTSGCALGTCNGATLASSGACINPVVGSGVNNGTATGVYQVTATTGGAASTTMSATYSGLTPALVTSSTAESAGGIVSYPLYGGTPGQGNLFLLAVTWKSNAAMSTLPTGHPYGGAWESVAVISQGTTLTTQVFRAQGAPSGFAAGTITISPPGSVKSTAVLLEIKGASYSTTNGANNIDNSAILAAASGANPSLNVVVNTNNSRVFGFLGNGNATSPTAGTGYTLAATKASTATGSATTKTTTSAEYSTALKATGTQAVPFTLGTIDWTLIGVSVKP